MKVIKPNTITASAIVSSTLTETEQAWSSTTTYAADAVVYDGMDGIYKALRTNTNTQPKNSPLDWIYLRPSNRWAMFDGQISTSSTATDSIELTFATGSIDGVALLNVIGNVVEITVRDGLNGSIIYSGIQGLVGDVYDWYQYFFYGTDIRRTTAIFLNIPSYTNTYTTIKVIGASGSDVSVGSCTFGKITTIGSSEYGFTAGITDYSKKETDDFGTTTFVRRAYSKRMSGRVLINNVELNTVQRTLYGLRAVPALWFASENPTFEEALVVYGYYRDFSTDISYPTYSYCSLDIEGLI